MAQEQGLLQEIGQLLVDAGPESANVIVVRAELYPEGDACKYEFDYVDSSDKTEWFSPPARAVGDLTELLVKLRNRSFLSGKAVWTKCEINFDVLRNKLKINYGYDEIF
ncbi:hypothetical protein [Pseudomonas fluorescens]|uniref:Uncharacterized protein n=1 Tax=Pseudomonas fluorescens TaxID=294 RepID=A0A0F4V4P1_PSEFL|nr:hypothetical protein [Pseudomonas fluorescens]KJZ63455.1 hypothetical protein VD17_22100 [Pseudomonas fluorescens]